MKLFNIRKVKVIEVGPMCDGFPKYKKVELEQSRLEEDRRLCCKINQKEEDGLGRFSNVHGYRTETSKSIMLTKTSQLPLGAIYMASYYSTTLLSYRHRYKVIEFAKCY